MYIAVSNANGWARAETIQVARSVAFQNSIVKDNRLRITVWECKPEAWVNGHGEVFGVLGEGTEYKRTGKSWKRHVEVEAKD